MDKELAEADAIDRMRRGLLLAKRNADYVEAEIMQNLRWQFERLRDSSIRALEQIARGEHPSEAEGSVAFMEIQRGLVRLGELKERQGLISFLQGQNMPAEESEDPFLDELCAVTPTRSRDELWEALEYARKEGRGINATRRIRNETGYGLKEAKDFVDRLCEKKK